MIASQQLARWVLAVFVLGTPLCPCASALADLADHKTDDKIDEISHHAGMHGDRSAAAEDSGSAPCHEVDAGADCGMADAADLAGLLTLERTGDLHWAALPFAAMTLYGRAADGTLARPPPCNPQRRQETPVTAGDRLLT